MIALWLGLALAQTCDGVALHEPGERLSVAWISPVGRTVGARAEVEVVPTAQLRAWVATEGQGSVGRMLQQLGMRRRSSDPRRRYKVVIFDAGPSELCRPVAGHEVATDLGGVVSCAPRHSGADRSQDGCGYTIDRATGEAGLPQYRGEWASLARDGFCVLPAERFVTTTTSQAP